MIDGIFKLYAQRPRHSFRLAEPIANVKCLDLTPSFPCPRCEAEFQELWWGHPVDPRALLGKWRAPNGFTILFAADGKCSGIAYDGKPFAGSWRVLHHGLLRVSVHGDDEPMFFTILSLRQSSLTIRSDEIGKPNENWVRI
jgi:hypothetical protein